MNTKLALILLVITSLPGSLWARRNEIDEDEIKSIIRAEIRNERMREEQDQGFHESLDKMKNHKDRAYQLPDYSKTRIYYPQDEKEKSNE